MTVETLKRCTHCKEPKPLDQFHKCRSRSDGLNNKCKPCTCKLVKIDRERHGDKRKAAFARWRDNNRDHLRQREQRRKMEKRAQCAIAHARIRARRRGLPFDLDQHADEIQARIDAGRCEMTGLPFNLHGGRTWDSPSIDRIVPAEGYVIGNIRVILHAMNAALGDWGESVLRQVVEAWTATPSSRKSRRSSSGRFSKRKPKSGDA